MNDQAKLCELCRLDDFARLSAVERLLQARGIDTDVWPERGGGRWPLASATSRLMVYCRDLIYARWIAFEAGVDAWPQE